MAHVDPTRTILHADMDAFYAAVEQRDDRTLRGRPVVVAGLGQRGVVSTASYEARVFGVHSAMPTAQARKLCPQAVYLRPDMARYVQASRLVFAVFQGFTDQLEPLSLDEAFLDVTGSQRLFGDGEAMAQDLRRQVRQATGLTVSVGVAANKFVAKVASDLHKPDGLTRVPPGSEPDFLAPLSTARLWGAGPATQRRLAALGCHTIGDVQRTPLERLTHALGPGLGRHLLDLALGRDERAVVVGSQPRSVGRETTFGNDLVGRDACLDVLLSLCEDVGRRLRRDGLLAGVLRLKLRYPPFETHTHQRRQAPPTADDQALYAAARALFDAACPEQRAVRLLGVTADDVQPARAPVQGQLFGAPQPGPASVDLALDAIRARFGTTAAARLGRGGSDLRAVDSKGPETSGC